MILQRDLDRWSGMKPEAVAAGSEAAIAYALKDAKHDIAALAYQNGKMLAALNAAKQFIENGVEMGFIRMPDKRTPDSAHDTLPAIEDAIRTAGILS
jgi:hypothetical protein